MTSTAPIRRISPRRALIAALAVAIGVLAIAVAARIGTLFPGGAAAATHSPGAVGSATISPAPSGSSGPSEEPTPPPPTPEATPQLVAAPLTGLPVTPAAALRHPIAVMVDDHADARPQAGFNAASVVWQAPAEGGVPRYMLVFQDTIPEAVGPIRSARQYYIEWAAELNAMYVHHGGSPQAKATLLSKGNGQWVWNADGFRWEGRFVFRVRDRIAPHNVMTDGDHLRRLAGRIGATDGPIEPAWQFAPDGSLDDRPMDGRITIGYGTPAYEVVSYRYDPTTNSYLRFVTGAGGKVRPQIDVADGRQVAPKNVVILRMAFGPLNDAHPEKDRLEASNIGTGQAWIATNGRTIKGIWRKDSVKSPTLLFTQDGRPVTLTAGQTFVQVIKLTDKFEIRDGAPPAVLPKPDDMIPPG